MGKVLASGHAEQDFVPDVCTVSITVEARGMTSAKAVQATDLELEKLLAELSGLGIPPEMLPIRSDRVEKPSYGNDDEYHAGRTIAFRMPVNTALVNRIHDVIASGYEDVRMLVKYDLTARAEHIRALTRQAIQDSRHTAELLAEATGGSIVGVHAANLGDDDVNMEIANLDLDVLDDEDGGVHKCCHMIEPCTPYSDRLNPEK